MSTGDQMWKCPSCGSFNYVVHGISCGNCAYCLVKQPVYGEEPYSAVPNPSTKECFVRPEEVFFEDKKDFLNDLCETVFKEMIKYNKAEEERIKNGKETKDYITVAEIVERMKDLCWRKV